MVAPVISLPNTRKAWPQSGRATQLFVQHSGETPLAGGYAESLTRASNANPDWQASWHSFVDPIARVRQVPWNLGAWTQGAANQFAIGMEGAGYAAYTRAQWMTAAGKAQLENLAHEWVYYWRIEKSLGNEIALRWLDTSEVRAVLNGNRTINGFCIHAQIEPANRTDAGAGFPYPELMARIKQLITPAPPVPTKPPAPATPAPAPKEELTVAEADRVIDYIGQLLVSGYSVGGVKHPGIGMVVEENQRRIDALPKAVATVRISRGNGVSWLQDNADATSGVARIEAKLAALVNLVAADKDISPEELKRIVDESTEAALEKFLGPAPDFTQEPVVFPITEPKP